MENKNESKKRIIRGMSVKLFCILAGVIVGLIPEAKLVSYANQNNTQDENNKDTEKENKAKKDIERIIDEELGISRDISKEDRQLLVDICEKELRKYTYYYLAKQKLENNNTLKLDDKQIEVAAKAYAYLKSEGVKEKQNIGTLVAMYLESRLRPYVISKDGNQDFGVLQWSYFLKKEYEKFLEKYNEENGTDYKFDDIEPQMAFYLKGSYDMFVKKGKSTVYIYNEQEFETGAKAGKWLEQNYCRPNYINCAAISKIASAFEDAFEGKKTEAFKKAFERIETTTALKNRFLGNTMRKPKESNLGETLGKGIDRLR